MSPMATALPSPGVQPAVRICVPGLFLDVQTAGRGYRPDDGGYARRQMEHFQRVLTRVVSVIK